MEQNVTYHTVIMTMSIIKNETKSKYDQLCARPKTTDKNVKITICY